MTNTCHNTSRLPEELHTPSQQRRKRKWWSLGKNVHNILFIFSILSTIFGNLVPCTDGLRLENQVTEIDHQRSGKLFPLFSIVRISNQPCIPDIPQATGTCYTNKQCASAGGTVSGTCASGFGVCCVVTATCESTIRSNNTNFRNKDFPNSFSPSGLEVCNVRIQKPSRNVCQVRLDFVSMNLAAADAMGQCMVDRLSINGAVGPLPGNLCGNLAGQHMYFDYGSSDRITLSVITDGAAISMSRDWNVKVTYIECNSLLRAPDGCLQYHTSATGQTRILAYPMVPHLADLDYTICVRAEDGAGSIVWSPCQGEPIGQSFLMTGAARTDDTGMPGAMCNDDYVLIMTDDTAMTNPKTHDRYCGNALQMVAPHLVRSIAKPFIMRVKTNAMEDAMDMMNTGFCLAWRQEPPRPK